MKEIITIGVGQYGANLTESIFEDMIRDHGIASDGLRE